MKTRRDSVDVVKIEPMLISVSDAAKLLGVSRSKCYEMIAAGTLPHLKIGSDFRLPVDGLKRWVDEHTHGGGSGPQNGAQRATEAP